MQVLIFLNFRYLSMWDICSELYLSNWVTSLSSGITHIHWPTDFHGNTTVWGQGVSYFKQRNRLCLCCKSNPEQNKNSDLSLWPTSIHKTLDCSLKKPNKVILLWSVYRWISKKISKIEVNWTPTLESWNKEVLMYKNDASPGAKRASLWDRMDHTPRPRKASCFCRI